MRRLAVFLLLVAPAPAQRKPITLESLAQAERRPMETPGRPVWSPDGKMFAYRQGHEIRIYNPASPSSKKLADTGPMDRAAAQVPTEGPFAWQNRRVRERRLQWAASDSNLRKDLLYEAGGDLFLISTANGKWRQLTHTPVAERDPKVSPDGTAVAFRRGWDLYSLDLASGKETHLTTGGSDTLRNGGLDWVYPEELDLGTAYWWSPDSKSIAYLQFDTSREPLYPHTDLLGPKPVYEPQRYPQPGDDNAEVHLGVVAAGGGATHWLSAADTRRSYLMARVGWLPDASGVWVERINRVQNRLALLKIPLTSGTPATIVEESDPYWINVEGEPVFLQDGRFLWLSERDGFPHLYLYSADGREVQQLTKGNWEVARIEGVDEAAGRVYYTSNEPSPVERHLYRIGLDGSDKRRLSSGGGVHSISMGPRCVYYVDTYSSAAEPPRATVRSGDGKQLGVYRAPDTRLTHEFDILPTGIVSFRGGDGTLFYARLIKPAGFNPAKKYPAIVTVYGGPDVQDVLDRWSGISLDQVYAHKGFVIWEMDGRGTSGRGHAFETPVYHHLGMRELEDQKTGVEHLISMGFVDPRRIGVYGWSYGGFMTLNALLKAPDLFRCGIAGAPVTDWLNYDTIYTERYMGLPADNREGYEDTALPAYAANLKAKLMIVHNIEDDNVLFENTLQMINALELAGKQFELALYPQKTHGVTGPAARQMRAAMVDFFERNLK